MRNLVILAALIFFKYGAVGQSAPGAKIAQVPDGMLSDRVYSNDVLGLKYELPSGWIVDANDLASLDYRTPDGRPASECLKILLSFHSPQTEGEFNSVETLFAIDPACFSEAKFPKSLNDKKKTLILSETMVKFFSKTPYITRKRADVGTVPLAGRVVVVLTGDDVINAGEGEIQTPKKALHVNTLLCLTESNGYWVAWAALADDPMKEQLAKTNISFQVSKLRNIR